MYRMIIRRSRGFTLVETIVCIAIIIILASIVYAWAGPARERARVTHCVNNLHQIGKAIQMYRQDYGGQDPPGALTAAQLGLPPLPFALWNYLRTYDVFTCPNRSAEEGRNPFSYNWHIRVEKAIPLVPPFSQVVAKRGEDTPLLSDDWHTRTHVYRPWRVIVLRLSGEVQQRTVSPEAPGWEW